MEVLAYIGQRKRCAPIHTGSTMDIHDPIPLTQKLVHCSLKMRQPVTDIRIRAVGSKHALISLGELVAKPGG